MNIIFEGIDAVGKTTLIKTLKEYFDKKKIKNTVIKEIEEMPLRSVLTRMLNEDPFFNSNKEFKTSIYETFLLAADFFYKQEYFREKKDSINIYDRDFLTVLCYQKIIIEKEYGEISNEFFKNFTKCLLFNLKNIDLLIYISIPLEESIKRVEKRDNKILTSEEKLFLNLAKKRFEIELIPELKRNGINIILLNGEEKLENNLKNIIEKINEVK